MSVETYLNAKKAFEDVVAKIAEVANDLAATAQALRAQPGRMIFSNCSVGLPMEASMSRDSVSINADHWKTPTQIQELLGQWHETRSKMMSAWTGLPDHMRANLVAPSDSSRPTSGRYR